MDLPNSTAISHRHVIQSETLLYRVHDEQFDGNGFNPCKGNPTRFTHLHDADGNCIPTSYAATTLDGAAFETVFRGIPDKYQAVPRRALDDRMLSVIRPLRNLQLVPLFTPELKAWRLDPAEVFAPRSDVYAFCRQLGFACWRDNPDADGLSWVSVQDSGAQAMLLFGDRLMSTDLDVVSARCVRTAHTALDDLESIGSRGGWFISK